MSDLENLLRAALMAGAEPPADDAGQVDAVLAADEIARTFTRQLLGRDQQQTTPPDPLRGNVTPAEGRNPAPGADDHLVREYARQLFNLPD